jgi:hypothetical protein
MKRSSAPNCELPSRQERKVQLSLLPLAEARSKSSVKSLTVPEHLHSSHYCLVTENDW